MAEIVWTGRAIADLNEIAEYIAYDNERAAFLLAERIVSHVEQLVKHPRSGSVIPEKPASEYRQIVEPPCRVFYKIRDDTVFIVHVMRSERILRMGRLEDD